MTLAYGPAQNRWILFQVRRRNAFPSAQKNGPQLIQVNTFHLQHQPYRLRAGGIAC
jgi:hypothetical protein